MPISLSSKKKMRNGLFVVIVIILLLTITIVCLTNYNGASPLKSIILLAIYFIYIFVQYNGRIIQKVMTIIPYFLIQILSEILVAFCLNNILFINNKIKIAKIYITLFINCKFVIFVYIPNSCLFTISILFSFNIFSRSLYWL